MSGSILCGYGSRRISDGVCPPSRMVIDKSILEKWYGPQPGGSLHDVYVVEIEGVYEG